MSKVIHPTTAHYVVRLFLVLCLLVLSPAQTWGDEHRISMTMKDAELTDVMDMISREQRVNIFVSTDSNEEVSFSLYD
ncbi:MAG: hypothetical protein WBM76_11545, partial [Woeseiaceae bacterium]